MRIFAGWVFPGGGFGYMGEPGEKLWVRLVITGS